jgi:hypothetical protein
MLALASAAHSGLDPTDTLLFIAAVGAAICWRFLLKVALPVILALLAVLLVIGASDIVQAIRSLLP